MKSKLLIILSLLVLLIFTIYKMMLYEESIREKRIINHYIEDESKALFNEVSLEDLQGLAANAKYNFKAGTTYFEKTPINIGYNTFEKHKWEKFFLKGVNLGVALPGKFPAEFSLTFDQYLSWLKKIGDMNSNVIRTYTILPPEFYKALAVYNLNNQNKPLYIMQGVWAEVPEDEDYHDPKFTRKFQKEIISVINVIHGKAVLKEKPGKASGIYTTDVSKYVVAYLLGREWEPNGVYKTVRENAKTKHYNGNFISIQNANAMEVWLAKMLDFTATYETQTYSWQHPISFVNWIPLDPMHHQTEFIENDKVREYDNDLMSIDFRKFNTSSHYKPGIYAAYHVYPYYPDYIYLKEKYRNAKNHKKENDNFYGYLEDLKQHTTGMPLVIAEYGLPSSRGISHFSVNEFHQGGHSEAKQAELSLTLTEDIYETGCAGAIFFEWADEWFKHNWLVMDFENPANDRKLWHNMENPEQNFGILALEDRKKTINGLLDDWEGFTDDNKLEMKAFYDATYFYLGGKLPDFDFNKNNLYIAFDTYLEGLGDHKLPFTDTYFENGFEFLAEFKSKDNAKLLVDEHYSVFTDIYNDFIPVYGSKYNENGKFIDQLMLVNRGRESLLGVKTDSIINNRGILSFGNSANPKTSNADWNWNNKAKNFELRLDWHLLNVSSPARKFVLADRPKTRKIEIFQTEGFNIYFFVTDKENKLLFQYPEKKPFSFTWDPWKKPQFKERLKPIYKTFQTYFEDLKPKQEKKINQQKITEKFEIAPFYNNKKGAISIAFNNAGYSQFEYAFPLLATYNINANFSFTPTLEEMSNVNDINEGIQLKRLGYKQLKQIKNYGNEISLQTDTKDFNQLKKLTPILFEYNINTLHKQTKIKPKNILDQIVFYRNSHTRNTLKTSYQNIPYSLYNTNISEFEFDKILKENKNKWSIFSYHHIYKDSSELKKINKENINDFFINEANFKKQIRLIRNSKYWIAPESLVFKYLKEKRKSKLVIKKYENMIFLTLKNNLNPIVYNIPLTIKYYTKAKNVNVSGSANDGNYTNRTGCILINIYPNKEVKLTNIE